MFSTNQCMTSKFLLICKLWVGLFLTKLEKVKYDIKNAILTTNLFKESTCNKFHSTITDYQYISKDNEILKLLSISKCHCGDVNTFTPKGFTQRLNYGTLVKCDKSSTWGKEKYGKLFTLGDANSLFPWFRVQ